MRKTPSLTRYIIGAMILGAIVGAVCHNQVQDSAKLASIAGYLSIGTEVFLRLIKMIVAPLVFATLVPGIAKMGDVGAVGRVGLKAMSWFVGASLVSLALGLVLANWLQPGANTNFPLPEVTASVSLSTNAFSLKDFITHLVPRSAAEAMAQNEILQVVVFFHILWDRFGGTRRTRKNAGPSGRSARNDDAEDNGSGHALLSDCGLHCYRFDYCHQRSRHSDDLREVHRNVLSGACDSLVGTDTCGLHFPWTQNLLPDQDDSCAVPAFFHDGELRGSVSADAHGT